VAKYEVEADLHCSVFQFTMQVKQLLGKDQWMNYTNADARRKDKLRVKVVSRQFRNHLYKVAFPLLSTVYLKVQKNCDNLALC
jgi:hypothetical protein